MLNTEDSNVQNVALKSFCAIPCVEYWRSQLHSSNIKNLNIESALESGTKKCYTYGLFGFHRWLLGKHFEYLPAVHVSDSTCKKMVTLRGIDHFLNLYRHNIGRNIEFVVLIKKYLIHLQETKNISTIDNAMFAIKSFFRENDLEINFRFNNSKRYRKPTDKDAMTLEDLHSIVSSKNIQPIELAVFMCKFHRGLDSATFADRFNFEVWSQLVDHFGTDDSNMWDISKCPVPIKIIRVKTNYLHTGFLDSDAIIALQKYLKKRTVVDTPTQSQQHIIRGSKTSMSIRRKPLDDEALFLDTMGNPISINWIGRRFSKLRRRAGVAKAYPSHEMRDLLKSTLIDSGCRPDVADHVIGHSPKDSYEKQALLYPENMRTEFTKASKRINILSMAGVPENKCHLNEKEFVRIEASLIDDLIRANRQLGDTLLRIQQSMRADSAKHALHSTSDSSTTCNAGVKS